MRCLEFGRELDFAGVKPSFHLKSLTKVSMFLLRAWDCSGLIGTGADFLTSVEAAGGCQIAKRWASTMVGI